MFLDPAKFKNNSYSKLKAQKCIFRDKGLLKIQSVITKWLKGWIAIMQTPGRPHVRGIKEELCMTRQKLIQLQS